MIAYNTILTLFRNMNQFSNCLEFYWLVNIVPNPQMINGKLTAFDIIVPFVESIKSVIIITQVIQVFFAEISTNRFQTWF